MANTQPQYIYKKNYDYCWIHITNIKSFIYLGANEFEAKIGQNITLNLSIKINYLDTQDDLENTVDYGSVCEHITQKIKSLNRVKLLEYLAEQLLNSIEEKFKNIIAAKISIKKGYVPLKEFPGKVKIEAFKNFHKEKN